MRFMCFFAFLLLFEELAFAGDIAVAFGDFAPLCKILVKPPSEPVFP
jgi:hypothetical protein